MKATTPRIHRDSRGPNAEKLIYTQGFHMEHLKFIIYRGEDKCAAVIASLFVYIIHVLLFITDVSYFDS